MHSHPNLLSIENSLLLVIDIQSKLVAAMPKNDAEQMLDNSRRLLEAAGILAIPVLLTEQYPKGLGPTDRQLTEKLVKNTAIFDKTGFSCLAADRFTETLKQSGRKQIIIIGQETHVCVLQTALELSNQGYQVHIVEDAVCSRKIEHKLFALQRMQQQGITTTCYESVLFEWLKNAKHPDFKIISRLLR
jgi:nicotinamidase-related amidase